MELRHVGPGDGQQPQASSKALPLPWLHPNGTWWVEAPKPAVKKMETSADKIELTVMRFVNVILLVLGGTKWFSW